MQSEWHEENQADFIDALSPIISPEIMEKISGLVNEFMTVYGTADIDTTGYRSILQQASQDALVYESGSCSNSQQITVNQANIWPMPSIANIMGWFQGSESPAVCKSCCIHCCECSAGCDQDLTERIGNGFGNGISAFAGCVAWTWWSGPISWSGCTVSGLAVYEVGIAWAIFQGIRCVYKCKGRPDCQQCPKSFYQPTLDT